MELRIDVLLNDLRHRPQEILSAIDADPLLIKRESGPLVLANASQKLFTPTAQHQLYAKGIVYRRDPYAVVSLPLIKIYNVGERNVTLTDLAYLANEPGVRVRFLRKIDGSLIQVFRAEGRVWFTTRGMLEGARWRFDEEDEDRLPDFDFLAESRALATRLYPRLLDTPALLEGRTLLFELIHPRARKVTSYGERADLILLAAFDHGRFAYVTHDELVALGSAHGLTVVDALSPAGETLAEQVDSLLASLAGTDQEGSVVVFEKGDEVVYRVKVKSPDYLQLMRLMAFCTYDKTVEMVKANKLESWEALEAHLREQGRHKIPEEVLGYYKAHYDAYQAYRGECEQLRQWAERVRGLIEAKVGGQGNLDKGAYRKAFAALAVKVPHSGLVFTALDGRLDLERVIRSIRSPREAKEALEAVAAFREDAL